jgi:hypothetical protein
MFSFPKRAKAKCAKLQRRRNFEFYLERGFLIVVIKRYHG